MNPVSEHQGLLRFLTAGSVDDGKSTLIGRLLYECEGLYEDQIDSVRKLSTSRDGVIDLSLFTDGLKAEREQAITIDVAYRHFCTAKRKFIIADTPGHEQYTRNMVTGASTADLAIILVDARKGLTQQTRRHAYIVWLLGITQVILAINKMDLIDFSGETFTELQNQFIDSTSFMHDLKLHCVPVSALDGDNIVRRSERMSWYSGPTLLELLETVEIGEDRELEPLRFPVQTVIRSESGLRGYAGQMASGTMTAGQEVIALPSRRRTKVDKIMLHEQTLQEAFAPQSVLVTLKDHIDLGRGDILVDPRQMPMVRNHLRTELIWMAETPLQRDAPYLIKHASQVLCCRIKKVNHRMDVRTFTETAAITLALNEIGSVEIETHNPMYFDWYSTNRSMGSFIMIDPSDNSTVAAGILSERTAADYLSMQLHDAAESDRSNAGGATVWFTGLSGAGKTTICNSLCTELLAKGFKVEVLDGDCIREKLNGDLGFSRKDRDENVRRIGFLAEMLSRHGVIVLVAAISPYRAAREQLRRTIRNFIEVYVNAPLAVCEHRDPKGLYEKVRANGLSGFTGIDDPYEPPLAPDVECWTDRETVRTSMQRVLAAVLALFSSSEPRVLGSAPAQPQLATSARLPMNFNSRALGRSRL